MTASKRSPASSFSPIDLHPFERAFRLRNLVAKPLESELDQRADRFLVIHDEDAPRPGNDLVELARRLDGHFLMPRGRQIKREGGAVMDL